MTFEIRDPIHGFIQLENEWERDIVNHWVFQRLRRIHQLGLTGMIYPGATHTRFEHSLGVMHVATRMYDAIAERHKRFLQDVLRYDDTGIKRDRALVRLAALLHDVGHSPFSHAGEDLMEADPKTDKPFKHEHYSAAAIRHFMRDVIDEHPRSQNYHLTADDVADFLIKSPRLGRSLFWASLVSGQLDGDRADYLLRDSHHSGVAYGHYDIERLIATLGVTLDREDSPQLAVEEGGMHAAEGLILARYMMFTQVYFHHTRRAFDHHTHGALQELLRQDRGTPTFPPPTDEKSVKEYLDWDDWRILGLIHQRIAGRDGDAILKRQHDRRVYETPEVTTTEDIQKVTDVAQALGDLVSFVDRASGSWYKFEKADVPILPIREQGGERLKSLFHLSSVVKGLQTVNQFRVYVPPEKKDEAGKIVDRIVGQRGGA